MKRCTTPSCSITIPLRLEPWQREQLETDFAVARNIYNSLVQETQQRYKQMVRTRRWRATIAPGASPEERKRLWEQQKLLRQEFRLSEHDFHKDVAKYQHHFKNNIGSHTAQKLASRLWKAYEDLFFGKGEAVRFCRNDEFLSIEGKTNGTGIVYRDDCLLYGPKLRLRIPVVVRRNDAYQRDMLAKKVKYCRILRKWVRNKWKYYLQLILEGEPTIKVDVNTGELKHPLGIGRVGIDIGTQTVAIVSDNSAHLLELAPEVVGLHKELTRVQRAMDRSRRAMNPDAYNPDGTYIKGKSLQNKSRHYMKLAAKQRELHRKQADIRKQSHQRLANFVLSLGNEIYIEDMSFAGLQHRAKETKLRPNGKFASKKRFGKSLANKAPAMFVSILEQKASAAFSRVSKIDTRAARASQYNHLSQTYKKKKLSQRTNLMPDGRRVQRDLYSAFLIQCTNETHDGFIQALCNEKYNNFTVLHDAEIRRLRGTRTLSSMGV